MITQHNQANTSINISTTQAILLSNQLTTDALSQNGNQKRASPWPPWTYETKSHRLAQSYIYVCHPELPNPELVKLSSRIKLQSVKLTHRTK